MKFENTRVYNFENSLRGMRNPKNSWHLSDSFYGILDDYGFDDKVIDVADGWVKQNFPDIMDGSREFLEFEEEYSDWLIKEGIIYRPDGCDCCEAAFIGPKDMHLAQLLIRSGPEHRKFLRQIFVSVDITAPLYW